MLNTLSFLDSLHKKVNFLLELHKQPLLQVLRYWDEWWFVPNEIEIPVKYIVKNFVDFSGEHKIEEKKFSYVITKESTDTFKIIDIWWSIHFVDIVQSLVPMDDFGAHRFISYNGKVFEDLRWSGNTYHHMISQREKIRQWTSIDVESWALSLEDAKKIVILNDFHDICEKEKGDVICSSKTDKHRQEESFIVQRIINEIDWLNDEKKMMQDILLHEHSQSIFKLYERMFYLVDLENLMLYADSYNKASNLIWAILSFQMPFFLESYQFVNGNKKEALVIASFKQHFKEYIPVVDSAFLFVKNNGIDSKWENKFSIAQSLWEEKIKPLL